MPYTGGMVRRVFYRIDDRLDGQFDAVVTIEPAKVIRRDGFTSMAEAEEWINGLRFLMAALGAPVAHQDQLDLRTDPSPSATTASSKAR